MQGSKYSFLELTVMPFLRRKVISADAAILFDGSFEQILWANAVGTELFGGRAILDLLGTNLTPRHPLISQIRNAAKQIDGDEPVVRGFRITRGLKSVLVQSELVKAVMPDGSTAFLLVCPEPLGSRQRHEHVLAELAVNSLDGFADAAAIVDEYGLTIAASSKFYDMAVNPDVLQELVKVA